MTKGSGIRSILLLLFIVLLFAQGATAVEGKKQSKQGGQYKQITGEVVSLEPDSIAIKSKSKGTMTFSVTKGTEMKGGAVKSGDKATVNYRVDPNGNTATRITAKTSGGKTKKKQTVVLPTDTAKAP